MGKTSSTLSAKLNLSTKVSGLFQGRKSVLEGFANVREKALASWRKAVQDHCQGRPIDLPKLLEAGPSIGIATSSVAQVFDQDCQVFAQHQEQLKTVAQEEAIHRQNQAEADGMEKEVERLQEALNQALIKRNAPRWSAQSLGHAKGDLERLERTHARLWDRGRQDNPQAFEEALSLPGEASEEVMEPAPIPAVDENGAFWAEDGD